MNDNNKPKSTIIKDAFSLFIITLICALALSVVYEITKEPIAKQEALKKEKAYESVFHDSISQLDEELMKLVEQTDFSEWKSSYKNVTIDEIDRAYDKNEELIGYIVQVSNSGYKDVITMAYGYSLDGTILAVEFLALNETPGLGMNASNPEFLSQFTGKKVGQYVVTKTGATQENEIDAISSSTITTDAIVDAINVGIRFLEENAELGGGADE